MSEILLLVQRMELEDTLSEMKCTQKYHIVSYVTAKNVNLSRLGSSSAVRVLSQHAGSPGFDSQHPVRLDIVVHACNPCIGGGGRRIGSSLIA